jgi:CcmD family protein
MKSPTIISSIFAIFFAFSPLLSIAQSTEKVEMATQFYGEGKIYIVIAILTIIFIGIILYLIRLDKKISKLEQEN